MGRSGAIHVVLSCAMSLDGFIDDASPETLILSSELDRDRVDELRASCDAILVGAGTIRADDPSLLVRSARRRSERLAEGRSANPIKVTMTRTGQVSSDTHFFTRGDGPKLVYCTASAELELVRRLRESATVIVAGDDAVDPAALLDDLVDRGVERLMIEGGTRISSLFLEHGLVDELRLAIAPVLVGDAEAPRFVLPGAYPHGAQNPMKLAKVEQLDGTAVLTYELVQ